jgi:CRP/FNR family transcriptional regulator, cyclic AMP receptor protein
MRDDPDARDLIEEYRGSWPQASFLAKLNRDALDAIVDGRQGMRLAAGDSLIAEGESAADVYLLMSGAVKVTARAGTGTALLAVRVGGDIVGEVATADGELRSATVTVARRETIAVGIPAAEFAAAIASFPAVGRLLVATLSRRLRASDRRRVDFTGYPVLVRVARVLAEMADEYGQQSERRPLERIVRIGLSQGELAALVGAKEARVTEVLKELRDNGALEWGYLTVTIKDADALRAAGRLPRDGQTDRIL